MSMVAGVAAAARETASCRGARRSGGRSGGGVIQVQTVETAGRTALCAADVWMRTVTSRRKSSAGRIGSLEGRLTHSPSPGGAFLWPWACAPPRWAMLTLAGNKQLISDWDGTEHQAPANRYLGSYGTSYRTAPDSPASLGGRWL